MGPVSSSIIMHVKFIKVWIHKLWIVSGGSTLNHQVSLLQEMYKPVGFCYFVQLKHFISDNLNDRHTRLSVEHAHWVSHKSNMCIKQMSQRISNKNIQCLHMSHLSLFWSRNICVGLKSCKFGNTFCHHRKNFIP